HTHTRSKQHGRGSLTFTMAAFLRWINQNRVPQRKLRDRLNPLEFYDKDEFLSRYSFTKETRLELGRWIGPTVKHRSDRNAAVPPMLQLLVALRYYATGCFKRTVGSRVSRAIASLKNQYIQISPTGEMAAGFYRRAGFPGVLGAIDCTHIPIQNPGGVNGDDEKSEITNIVARWPGYDSQLYLMTPLLTPQTPTERRCNSCHIAARGVMLDTTFTINVAVTVLYNFGNRHGDELHLEANEGPQEDRENDQEHNANPSGNSVRQTLIENHFSE
uniref:DDE Tnp4 domain-containing protein n=1 Tax=Seriola dumerili TaxID=41447 RepID=A0A3B4V1M9_SERDU